MLAQDSPRGVFFFFFKSSFPVRFNLRHRQPSLFRFALESPLWCFSSLKPLFLGFPTLEPVGPSKKFGGGSEIMSHGGTELEGIMNFRL